MACPSCGASGYLGGDCLDCSFVSSKDSLKHCVLLTSVFLTTLKTHRYVALKPELIRNDDLLTNEFMKSKLESVPIDTYAQTPNGMANILLSVNDQYLALFGQPFSPVYVAANQYGVNSFLNPCLDDDPVEISKLLTAAYSASKSLVRDIWDYEIERDYSPRLPILDSVEKLTGALKAFGLARYVSAADVILEKDFDLAKFFYEKNLTDALRASKSQMEVAVQMAGLECDFGRYGRDQRYSVVQNIDLKASAMTQK